MNKVKGHCTGIHRFIFAVVLLAVPGGALLVQGQGQAAQTPAQGQQDQKQTDKSAVSTQEEVKITPRQAEELFHSVDEILDFDSKQSGLPIKREVKRKLTSRDEVVSYLTKHLDDEDTKRLRRSELVLKEIRPAPARV